MDGVEQLVDGFVTQAGGVHMGLHPLDLQPHQYARGINITVRGGMLSTRQKFVEHVSIHPGRILGYGLWSLNSGDRIVLAYADGIRIVNLATGGTTLVAGFASASDKIYCVQADKYMVLQNRVNQPIRLEEDGAGYIRTEIPTGDTTPVGSVMAYGHGRLFVVPNTVRGTTESGRRFIEAGDVILPTNPARIFSNTEGQYLNEGGAMGFPAELGFIQAMTFLRAAETGTGVGALIVFCRHGSGAFQVNVPRAAWKDQDIGQVLFIDVDMRSPDSLVHVNGDIYFRSADGWRSLRYTVSQASGQGGLANVPQTAEIGPELAAESEEGIAAAAGAYADNRLMVLTGAESHTSYGTVFRRVAVADFALAYSMSGVQPAVWEGMYSGPLFRGVVSAHVDGTRKAVFIAYRADGSAGLYTLEDAVMDQGSSRVRCVHHTRMMAAQSPATLKRIMAADLWVSGLRGQAELSVYYRADGYPYWMSMGTRTLMAADVSQRRRWIRFIPQQPLAVDPATKEGLQIGFAFQLALVWTGELKIERVRMECDTVPYRGPDYACNVETAATELVAGGMAGVEIDEEYVL